MGKLVINGKTLEQAILDLRRQPEVELLVSQRGLASPDTQSGVARKLAQLRTLYGKAALAQITGGSVDLQRRTALTKQLKEQKLSNNMQGARSTSQQLDQLLKIAGRE